MSLRFVPRRRRFAQMAFSIAIGLMCARSTTSASDAPDFAREVRPILSKCVACHGPDVQENGLRLDTPEGSRKLKAIVPGSPEKSAILLRVTSQDPDVRMPPPDSGDMLPAADVEKLRGWIAAGAEYTPHWAFRPIADPPVPIPKSGRPTNPIDAFVQAELDKAGLTPSPAAAKATQLRRVSLDLIGLPPTREEVVAYLADTRPDAYVRQVRRLLASPHYGERQARHWLDLARYADSNGYTIDGPRSIWPWRDWVIAAFNQDMPFDRFTELQLAGDLLPGATAEQKLATGFHRNTSFNEEGGTDPVQFRVERDVDRTNTTGSVWLGLTMGCAQCHNHKYDPISQRDYYRLYSFFADADEPLMGLVSDDLLVRRKKIESELAARQTKTAAVEPVELPSDEEINRYRFDGRNHFRPAPIKSAEATKAKLTVSADHAVLASGESSAGETYTIRFAAPVDRISAVRLDALTDPSLPKNGPGRAGNGNFVLSHIVLTHEGKSLPFASADADIEQDKYPVVDALKGLPDKGWAINPGPGEPLNQPRMGEFKLVKPLEVAPGAELTLTLKFAEKPSGYTLGKFRIVIADGGPEFLALPVKAQKLITDTIAPLEVAQKQQFVDLLNLQAKKIDPAVAVLRDQLRKLDGSVTSLVMAPAAKPRTTRIHQRGDFLQPGEEVDPGTPEVFDPKDDSRSAGERLTRLDLARWLTRPDHPLTPRVTVNREWQKFFGLGLVETENDFGVQGALPSHPALLDWLARRFVADGWSLKRLHFLIVTSDVYMRSSNHRPDLAERDPLNRLLARQNRLRLDAETIRDNALAVSGTLARSLGGKPVYPPQPAELFQFTQSQRGWEASTGPDRYRRGIYTWIWRQSRHPLLTTFDGADAQVACTRRNRSNTPLQALHLANDPVFVELAESWGRSVAAARASGGDRGRIERVYADAFARTPDQAEAQAVERLVMAERAAGRTEPQVWTTVARLLMNTDEFITRE